jgi:peptide deformylase
MLDFMPLVFLNPVIELVGKKAVETEGCLSIIGVRAPVGRPSGVKVTCKLLNGEVVTIETDGLFARAFQHEIDHLEGILFLDRLSPASKMAVRKRMRQMAANEADK